MGQGRRHRMSRSCRAAERPRFRACKFQRRRTGVASRAAALLPCFAARHTAQVRASQQLSEQVAQEEHGQDEALPAGLPPKLQPGGHGQGTGARWNWRKVRTVALESSVLRSCCQLPAACPTHGGSSRHMACYGLIEAAQRPLGCIHLLLTPTCINNCAHLHYHSHHPPAPTWG